MEQFVGLYFQSCIRVATPLMLLWVLRSWTAWYISAATFTMMSANFHTFARTWRIWWISIFRDMLFRMLSGRSTLMASVRMSIPVDWSYKRLVWFLYYGVLNHVAVRFTVLDDQEFLLYRVFGQRLDFSNEFF